MIRRYSTKFRSNLRNDYIASAVEFLMKYSPRDVRRMMEEAVLVHDNFPSLSQLHELAVQFKCADKTRVVHRLIAETVPDEQLSPWPVAIEAVMLMIRDDAFRRRPRVFQLALGYNRLTEDDAWYLWECFCAREFVNDKIEEILSRHPGRSTIRISQYLIESQRSIGSSVDTSSVQSPSETPGSSIDLFD